MKNYNNKQRRRKSIFIKLLVPFLTVTIIQTMLVSALFLLTGTFETLNKNEAGILVEKVKYRRSYIQAEMNRWANIDECVDELNKQTDAVLTAYPSANLTDLNQQFDGYALSEHILLAQSDGIINYLLRSTVDGAFIILNDAQTQQSGVHIQINDYNNGSTSDLMLRVAPSATKEYIVDVKNIAESAFSPHFTIDETTDCGNYFYKPFRAAQNTLPRAGSSNNERDYGYWSRPFCINNEDSGLVVTYSVPLIASNTVYGVIGVEITMEHFLEGMPYAEINSNFDTSYIFGIQNGNGLEKVFVTGDLYDKTFGSAEQITVSNSTYENVSTLKPSGNKTVLGCVQNLDIYNANSPFADSWVIAGMINEDDLFAFTNYMQLLFIGLIIILLLFGVGTALVVSFTVSAPVLNLTHKIKETKIQDRLTLDRCNIYEMDQLVEEIIKLSDRLVETERAEKARVEYERDYDFLTNLLNRRAFMRKLEDLETQPDKLKTAAMVMLDMDGLKYINDTYGHQAGDEYLSAGASILRKYLGQNTLIGRIGGDEFTVFFYGYESRASLNKTIAMFRDDLKKSSIFVGTEEYKICFSAGVAWYPTDAVNMELLIKYADHAMYYVKKSGKNSMEEFKKNMFPVN